MALAESRKREGERERTVARRRKVVTERGRDGQTESYMRGRESEVAPGIKAAEPRMTTERMGEGWREKGKEREKEGGQDGHRQTDRQ